MLRERIQIELQIPDRFSAVTEEGHRLIRMNPLRFQEFKDPSFRFAIPLVDKRHTLRVSVRRDTFANDDFKPAILAIGLFATMDIATVQSDRERRGWIWQGLLFIFLWGDKQEPFFSQFPFHALGYLVDVPSKHSGTDRMV